MTKTFAKEVREDESELLVVVETMQKRQTFPMRALRIKRQALRAQLDEVNEMIAQARALNIEGAEDE